MLQKGDILFSKPKKGTSRQKYQRKIWVEWPQREEFGHAAIYVGNGHIVEAQLGPGVIKVPLKDWAKRNEYRVFRVRGATREQKKRAAEMAETMIGKGYSLWKAVKSFFTKKEHEGKYEHYAKQIGKFNNMFCSTVIVGAYPEIPMHENKHPFHLLPVDIMRSSTTYEVK